MSSSTTSSSKKQPSSPPRKRERSVSANGRKPAPEKAPARSKAEAPRAVGGASVKRASEAPAAKVEGVSELKGAPAPRGESGFDGFMSRLAAKDRSNVDRHIAACEKEATEDHGKLWKRLAGYLSDLSPRAVKTAGQKAVQYFIADGNYNLQLFALEDTSDGKVSLYVPDATAEAIKAKLLTGQSGPEGEVTEYPIRGAAGASLMIEALTVDGTRSAPDYCRHMLGWNRKAVRITLPTHATLAQIKAVEGYCALAAQKMTAKAGAR